MEPVLGGRDDEGRHPNRSHARRMPQWSPSLADGTTSRSSHRGAQPALPQWSPSLADGTTRDPAQRQVRRLPAAMEPVLGGRDDGPTGRRAGPSPGRNGARPWRTGRLAVIQQIVQAPPEPQWSPSLADGTTCCRRSVPRLPRAAAMEPVLGGRDDSVRLGAGARRDQAAMEPVLGGRDDADRRMADGPAIPAAMEPVLGGRDDLSPRAGHSPAIRRRNGARPWRTGRPASGTGARRARTSRNGARPWRTGRRVDVALCVAAFAGAAMEPVLGGRDDLGVQEG